MAADDDGDIPLQITVGDSGQQLAMLSGRLVEVYEGVNKLLSAFDVLGKNGPKQFKDVLSQVGLLKQALAEPSAEIGLLNAMTKGANATARAVKEIDVQGLLRDARQIVAALKSEDEQIVKLGRSANDRLIAQSRLGIERINNAIVNAGASEIAGMQATLQRMERSLVLSQERERAAVRQLERLTEQNRITAGVQSRQRSSVVSGIYANTPEAQADAARKAAQTRDNLIDRAERIDTDRDVSLARRAEEERIRAEKAQDNLIDRAERIDTDRDVSLARRAEQEALREQQRRDNLIDRAERIDFDRDVKLAQRTTPANQATRNEDYRQTHYDRMFGDGGAAIFETQARLMLNYAALNAVFTGLRDGAKAVLEYDVALHELQAITSSTNEEIQGLGRSLLGLSTGSKFSIKELTDAAVDMAKSGLTMNEIQNSLSHIQTLATVTGTPLKETTDLYVSAMETFKVTTGEADKITEQLSLTLNSSRLDVDKLKLAFQGIGVTAKESGLGFAETTSALAALSNAGLTSGQQLSQGFRQVLVDLDAPGAKFKQRLQELHIPLTDISVQSNGLVGVFENLKAGGFSASDAFETLGARASTAFIAMLDHTDAMKSQYELTLNATGALKGQATATDTLEASWRRVTNTLTSLLIGSSSTVLGGLKSITGGVANMTSEVDANSAVWKGLFTLLTGVAIAGAGKALLSLVTNLRLVRDTVKEVSVAVTAMNVANGETAVVSGLSGTLKSFGWMAVISIGIAGVIALLDAMRGKEEDLAAQGEILRGAETRSKSAYEEKGKVLETLNEFMNTTIARSGKLKTDQDALNNTVLEARNRFGQLGTALDGVIPTYEILIQKMGQLRTEMQASAGIDLQNLITTLRQQGKLAGDQLNAATGNRGLSKALEALGVDDKYSTGDPLGSGGVAGAATSVHPSIAAAIQNAAANNNLDPELLRRLQRSEGVMGADGHWKVSSTGAVGPMQVLNSTFAGVTSDASKYPTAQGLNNNLDPDQNVAAGASYFAYLLGKYKSPRVAILAYHDGETKMDAVLAGRATSSSDALAQADSALAGYVPGASALDRGKAAMPSGSSGASVLDYIASSTHSMAETEKLLRALNDDEKANRLPAATLSILRGLLADVASPQQTQLQKDAALKTAEQQDRVTKLNATPAYQDAQRTADDIRLKMGDQKSFDSIGSASDRTAKFQSMASQVDPMLKMLDDLRASYTNKDDTMAFDASDVGKAREQLEARRREIEHSVTEYAGDVATATGKLSVETLNKQISELQAELTHEGKTIKDPVTEGKLKGLAEQRRDLQLSMIKEEIQKDNEKSPVGSALRDPAYQKQLLESRTTDANTEYQKTINRADYTGEHPNLNNPIGEPQQSYASQLAQQMSGIDKTASTGINLANQPTKNAEAMLNAASENQDFPKAVIDLRKHNLADTKVDALGAELQVRLAQIKSLQDLETQADAMAQKNNSDFQEVANKFGVKVSADGTIDEGSLNFSSGSQRSEFKTAYDKYMANMRGIPAEKAKIQQEMNTVNADIAGIKGKTAARTEASSGDLSTSFNASKADFDLKNGLLPTQAFKNQTDSISKMMNDMNASTSAFFVNLVTGANKGKGAFSDFAQSILKDALKMATDKASSQLMSGLFSLVGKGIGAVTGAFSSTPDYTNFDATAGPGHAYSGGIVVDKYNYGGGMPGITLGAAEPMRFYMGGNVMGGSSGSGFPSWPGFVFPKLSMPSVKLDVGGIIPGADMGRDSVHALLAPGEAILNRSAVGLVGTDMVDAMNKGALRRAQAMPSMPSQKEPNITNVWVVDKTTQPPPPGPRDMIAAITDDILVGGQTKKLIQQVTQGQI